MNDFPKVIFTLVERIHSLSSWIPRSMAIICWQFIVRSGVGSKNCLFFKNWVWSLDDNNDAWKTHMGMNMTKTPPLLSKYLLKIRDQKTQTKLHFCLQKVNRLFDYKPNQIFWTSEPGPIMDDITFCWNMLKLVWFLWQIWTTKDNYMDDDDACKTRNDCKQAN